VLPGPWPLRKRIFANIQTSWADVLITPLSALLILTHSFAAKVTARLPLHHVRRSIQAFKIMHTRLQEHEVRTGGVETFAVVIVRFQRDSLIYKVTRKILKLPVKSLSIIDLKSPAGRCF